MQPNRLIADIGGTNIRFARIGSDRILTDYVKMPWTSVGSFSEALLSYRASLPSDFVVRDFVLDAAGPVNGGEVRLTNRDVVLRAEEISHDLDGVPVSFVNDLAAVAAALPYLDETDVIPLRGTLPKERNGPMIAINVGTGFGASTVVPTPHGWVAIAGEGGHISLPPRNEVEASLFGHNATIEDYISGRGLQNLSEKHSDDPILHPNSETFLWHLGRAAGDLTLGTGAWNGVFLVGGVLDAWGNGCPTTFDSFLDGFHAKGAMQERMKSIPICRITHKHPALIGLANYDTSLSCNTISEHSGLRVALIAHDAMKSKMTEWVSSNYQLLKDAQIYCTGTTGERILSAMPDLNLTRLKSGPLGGDQQIGAMICEGKLDALIFFIDPLSAMPHDVDVKALTRLAIVYDLPMANSFATADRIMRQFI